IGPMEEERYQDDREGGGVETATAVKRDGGGHNGGRKSTKPKAPPRSSMPMRSRKETRTLAGVAQEGTDQGLPAQCTSSRGSVGSHCIMKSAVAVEASKTMAGKQGLMPPKPLIYCEEGTFRVDKRCVPGAR